MFGMCVETWQIFETWQIDQRRFPQEFVTGQINFQGIDSNACKHSVSSFELWLEITSAYLCWTNIREAVL